MLKKARSGAAPAGGAHASAPTVSEEEIAALIERYAAGPDLVRAALDRCPHAAIDWKPGPTKWSVHEVVVHCADAEVNAHGRLRYVLAEKDPLIVAYDQDVWAAALQYDRHPIDLAMATVVAVRANTVPLLLRLPSAAWARKGRHTETGEYTALGWLRAYAEHLETHARQIDRNVAAFRAASRP